jgi:hypothetical protein
MAGKKKTTTPSVKYGKGRPLPPAPKPIQPAAPPRKPTGKGYPKG